MLLSFKLYNIFIKKLKYNFKHVVLKIKPFTNQQQKGRSEPTCQLPKQCTGKVIGGSQERTNHNAYTKSSRRQRETHVADTKPSRNLLST